MKAVVNVDPGVGELDDRLVKIGSADREVGSLGSEIESPDSSVDGRPSNVG